MTDSEEILFSSSDFEIDNISINDSLWFQIRTSLISFGFKGLPKNVHFTISFDESSSDINFHVTKNHADVKDKPKIRIFEIDKKVLSEFQPALTSILLNLFLKPIDVELLKNEHSKNIYFIASKNLERNKIKTKVWHKLIEGFKPISKIKKRTRLKIKGDVESALKAFASSKGLYSLMKNAITYPPKSSKKQKHNGILIAGGEVIHVISISGKWFTINEDITPIEALSVITNPSLAKKLINETKRAIIRVKYAKSNEDVRAFSKPIRLIYRPPKEN